METIGFHAKHMKTPRMAHVRLPKLGHLPGPRSCHEGRKSAPFLFFFRARQKMQHQFQFLQAGIVRTGLSILESCGTPCAPSSRRTIERRSVSVTSTSPSTRRGGSLLACAIFVRFRHQQARPASTGTLVARSSSRRKGNSEELLSSSQLWVRVLWC